MRDWFKARAETLGCTVTVDDMGAMFARRRGQRSDVPPIGMGSHLDTQPTGGKFDGALGVLAALEALRTLLRAGYETFAPIEVVNWTNEEGSRFAPPMIASGVFAGVFSARLCARAKGPRRQELRRGARRRSAIAGWSRPAATSCRLSSSCTSSRDRSWKPTARTSASSPACRRCTGTRSRSPARRATPAPRRCRAAHDALLGAARLVEVVNAIARKFPEAVGTVGRVEVRPGSPNVIPGEVYFTLDLRDLDAAVIDAMEKDFIAASKRIGDELGLQIAFTPISAEPAVRFDKDCVASVRAAAKVSGFSSRDIVSRAGHDATYILRVAPTAMIFVPCKDGISHNEAEYSSKEQCAAGAQVLLQAVLDYDRRLAERSSGQ